MLIMQNTQNRLIELGFKGTTITEAIVFLYTSFGIHVYYHLLPRNKFRSNIQYAVLFQIITESGSSSGSISEALHKCINQAVDFIQSTDMHYNSKYFRYEQ